MIVQTAHVTSLPSFPEAAPPAETAPFEAALADAAQELPTEQPAEHEPPSQGTESPGKPQAVLDAIATNDPIAAALPENLTVIAEQELRTSGKKGDPVGLIAPPAPAVPQPVAADQAEPAKEPRVMRGVDSTTHVEGRNEPPVAGVRSAVEHGARPVSQAAQTQDQPPQAVVQGLETRPQSPQANGQAVIAGLGAGVAAGRAQHAGPRQQGATQALARLGSPHAARGVAFRGASAGGTVQLSPATQIERAVGLALRQGGGTVTIRLSPEHLGAVRVTVGVEGSTVSLRVEASSESARRLLESSSETLRRALEAQGLAVERLEVGLRSDERATEGPNPRGGGDPGPHGGGTGHGPPHGGGGSAGRHSPEGSRAGATSPTAEPETTVTDLFLIGLDVLA